MNKDISTQYDNFVSKYIEGTLLYNDFSKGVFYSILENLGGKKLLDVGCGDGSDLVQYNSMEAICYGIDASSKLVELAKSRFPFLEITCGLMEQLPYVDNYFDVVVSKYVLQSSNNLPQALKEMARVLRPGGVMAYLTVHPIRQFLEKNKHPKDYFISEIVESKFFGGSVSALEPTHTLEEYLNLDFLREFRIDHFEERPDFPSSLHIDGDTYPCFFILKAEKIS